jgi:hypothetical protein
MAAAQLDRAAGSLPSAAALAALIAPPASNQGSNQSPAPLPESTAATPPPPPDSGEAQTQISMQSKPDRRHPLPCEGRGPGG